LIDRVREFIAKLSWCCFVGSMACLVALVATMLWEVVGRYGLNAPTIWGYDVTRFLTGATFLLGCAWCQRERSHIRIDFLVARVRPERRGLLEAVFLIALLAPALLVMSLAGVQRGWSALVTGEVDTVSPWAPRVWPFYCTAALSLMVLLLQCLSSLSDCVHAIRGRPEPGAGKSDTVMQ